jgi:hypothetical protein|tara:strand:+ start:135 stop:326 length:192 start_codon:yes stop_codon:yes gene_type:complete
MTTTDTNRLQQLITILEGTRDDHDKFFGTGNNAAGTRVRKAMQEVKTLAQELRLEVQETKNTG